MRFIMEMQLNAETLGKLAVYGYYGLIQDEGPYSDGRLMAFCRYHHRSGMMLVQAHYESTRDEYPYKVEGFVPTKLVIQHGEYGGIKTVELERGMANLAYKWEEDYLDPHDRSINWGLSNWFSDVMKSYHEKFRILNDLGGAAQEAAEKIQLKYWPWTNYAMLFENHIRLESIWQKHLPYASVDFAKNPLHIDRLYEKVWQSYKKEMLLAKHWPEKARKFRNDIDQRPRKRY